MAASWVLALDQGGHASRALLFEPGGRLVAQAERRIATQRHGRDRVEHSAGAVLRSLQLAVGAVLVKLPRRAQAQAALATQRSSIACWDRRTGRALSPVISWQDRRAARRVAALAKTHGARVRELTGLVCSPHYGASKVAWCLKQLPAVKQAAAQGRLAAGPLASYLVAGLTAEQRCLADPVNAARTQLLDLRRAGWSEELCRLFGVPHTVLPECVENRYAFGELHIAGRRFPLSVVTGDQPAALFAQGPPEAGVGYVNIGTGAFVQCLAGEDAPGLLHSLLWREAGENVYALEGTVNGAAAALDATAADCSLSPRSALRLLPEALASTQEPPLFLNGIGGLGAPYWQPRFRSRFVGRGNVAMRLAAVVESVVFLLQRNLDGMQTRVPLRKLRLSGGLSQLDGLCQRLADLSGLPVERPELHEATARGLAYLAGGILTAADRRREFLPRSDPALAARAQRWRQALETALH